METQEKETLKARLLLILKYGDICFTPGYKTEEGYKLIVSDPDDQIKDLIGYFYTNISIFLSKKVAERVPETNKMEARVAFKTVKYNDTTFIDEKDVYKQLEEKFTKPSVDLTSIMMVDDSFLEPMPAVL